MVTVCILSIFLICFAVATLFLVRRMAIFFKKNYLKQRQTLIATLILFVMSFFLLGILYTLMFVYSENDVVIQVTSGKVEWVD